MAFYSESFTFNEIPCDEFDLMIYDVGSDKQSTGAFASTPTVVEQSIYRKWRPLFYGMKYTDKLTFELVFGVNQSRLDENKFLDREELNIVSTWLTGHEEYKWLSIMQDGMEYVRFKCYVSDLEIVDYGWIPWALKAKITCDSPFGYMAPHTYTYTISGDTSISFYNESSYNGYYYPKIQFSPNGSTKLTITNNTDDRRQFILTDIPTSVKTITVDNENGIITNDADLNLYDGFNFNFLRLKRGYNKLTVTGDGALKIICEFPVNTGG